MESLRDGTTPVQRTEEDQFLAVIESRASLPRHLHPTTAALAAMSTLAKRLTPGQSHLLLEAFPQSLQPMFAQCMERSGQVVEKFEDASFLDQLALRLDVTPAHAEIISDAVFRAVRARLPVEMIEHVAAQLPKDLGALWVGAREPIVDIVTEPEGGARQALLSEIVDAVPLPIGVTAPDALSAVMCAFSRRVSGGEARDLLLGAPDEVRPLLERCMLRRDEPAARFDRDELVATVARELATTALLAEQIVHAVFGAVKHQLPTKVLDDVASKLPSDLRETWVSA